MWNIYTIEYYSVIKRTSWVICRDVDGPRVCYIEQIKLEWEKQILYINAYMCNLKKKAKSNPICSAGKRCRHREWTCGHSGEESVRWIGRLGLTYIHWHM